MQQLRKQAHEMTASLTEGPKYTNNAERVRQPKEQSLDRRDQ